MKQILKIEEPAFDELRTCFNGMLESLIRKMGENGNDTGVLNFKLVVSIEDAISEFDFAYKKPSFEFEVNTEVKEKTKITGAVMGDYQLSFDKEEGAFILNETPKLQQNLFNRED